jgi:hypothetical protein
MVESITFAMTLAVPITGLYALITDMKHGSPSAGHILSMYFKTVFVIIVLMRIKGWI